MYIYKSKHVLPLNCKCQKLFQPNYVLAKNKTNKYKILDKINFQRVTYFIILNAVRVLLYFIQRHMAFKRGH